MTLPPSTWTALNKGGPIAIICGILLYIVYMVAVSGQEATESQLKAIAKDTTILMEQHTNFVEVITDSAEESRRQTILLQKICLNAADTNSERKDCLILEP